jgi:hypothetical protein
MDISNEVDVEKQEQKAKEVRRQELNDIRTVLSSVSGRRLVWRLLESCNTFSSIYSEEPLLMARLSGKQDLGHFLMAEIVEADEGLLLRLMKDNKAKENK